MAKTGLSGSNNGIVMAETTSSKESVSGTQKIIIQGIWATAFVGVACLGVFVLPKQFAPQSAPPMMNGYQPQPGQYPQQSQGQYPQFPGQQPGFYPQPGQYPQQPQYQAQQFPLQQPYQPPQVQYQQQPVQQQPVQQTQQTQQAQPNAIASAQPITRQGVDSGYEIADLNVANQLLTGLASLASISDTPAGQQASEKNTIVMFFDPRCPYCQAAHKALSGKYPIRFVPVSVLGDQATQLDALPGIRGVLKQQDKVKALHNLMAQQTQGLDMSPDANLDKEVNQNFEVWLTLAANLPDRAPAVPLFVVPKASGKVAVLKGWDNSMMPVVDALLKELGSPMGLFDKKKKFSEVRVPKFALATLPDPVAPSIAREQIIAKQQQLTILWTALIVGTLAVLLFGYVLQANAVTEPYVADGGVFGCPVPILQGNTAR